MGLFFWVSIALEELCLLGTKVYKKEGDRQYLCGRPWRDLRRDPAMALGWGLGDLAPVRALVVDLLEAMP